MLESGGPDQNQDDLLNLLGMESVEFVFTIMEHRDALLHPPEVLSESMITTKGLSHVRHLRDGHHDHRDDGNININDHDNINDNYNDKEERWVKKVGGSKPIDELGLNATYLSQLKQQGLRLKNEPRGYDDRYKGYMSGVKLNHDLTSDERCGGSKTYHDVCELIVHDSE